MKIKILARTFVITALCQLWWHCCICDSSSIKQPGEVLRHDGNSADLQIGPNSDSGSNTIENLEGLNNEIPIQNTIQNEAQAAREQQIVNSIKVSKSENAEASSVEKSKDDAAVQSESPTVFRRLKNVDEHTDQKQLVDDKHLKKAKLVDVLSEQSNNRENVRQSDNPENVKLPSAEHNLSTSRTSTSNTPPSEEIQLKKSVPQVESSVLEDSTPPTLSSSSEFNVPVYQDSVLPSHQHSTESQTIGKADDVPVATDAGTDSEMHHQHPHSEAMPSFDEWKRMMLAEQEKEGMKIPSVPPGKKIASQKRKRNYSSYECGAKIVGSNSEAEGTSRILNELVDEYMLNPCKAKIWFVIELCETVQALQIELANFELFSSCPKDFAVYSSDHYPSRDWKLLGTFTAAELRVLQSFELKQEGYGKFFKVELLSYYGKEHYCPLSVVRIFGTSMVDEYEEMETAGNIQSISEDDEDRLDVEFNVEDLSPGNLFGSAKDAVLNMVKKAAQVLVRDQSAEGENLTLTEHQNMSQEEVCKLFPGSSESCTGPNATSGDMSVSDIVPDFLIPYSPLHHALFRYLRNCESCIIPSQEENLTSAQPTCRFFQAALGPVLFKGICEVFRENPLTTVKPGMDAHDVPLLKNDATKVTPKHSTSTIPPPQIISVIIDGTAESKSLPAYSDSVPSPSVSQLDASTSAVLEEVSLFSSPKIEDHTEMQIKTESIKPTKASQDYVKEEEWIASSSSSKISKESEQIIDASVVDVVQPSLTDLKTTVTVAEHVTPSPVGQSSSLDSPPAGSSESVTDSLIFTISEKPIETEQGMNDTVAKISTVKYEDSTAFTEPAAFMPDDFTEAFQSQHSGSHDISKEEKESVLMGSVLSPSSGQKESVFMRMSNRIKSLELNMSLSSQYLQELSQRYRRQMEEMQRAFNRTVGTLNDTARKAAERDVKQQEVISTLQSQVANLSRLVDFLVDERSSFTAKLIETHIFLIVMELIVVVTILSLCARRIYSNVNSEFQAPERVVCHPRSLAKRRNSLDSSLSPILNKVMRRSFSEETPLLNPVAAEPVQPNIGPAPKVKKKKSRKRNRGLRRSNSNPSLVVKNSKSVLSTSNECKDKLCSAGVLFSASKPKKQSSKPADKGSGHSYCDENCNITNCPKRVAITNCNKGSEKEKRLQGSPLQNLTNGVVSHDLGLPNHGDEASDCKETNTFSLKKFLKFPKRDSV